MANAVKVDYFSAIQRQKARVEALHVRILRLSDDLAAEEAALFKLQREQRDAEALDRAGLGVR